MKLLVAVANLIATTVFTLAGSTSLAHEPHEPAHSHLVFQNGALHAHASWTTGPQVNDESVLRLEFKDASTHQSIELNATVKVVLWMPDMGHGSSPTQTQRVTNEAGEALPGAFNIKDIYFIMGGKWEVNVTLTYPNGQTETQTINVEIAGGHHH